LLLKQIHNNQLDARNETATEHSPSNGEQLRFLQRETKRQIDEVQQYIYGCWGVLRNHQDISDAFAELCNFSEHASKIIDDALEQYRVSTADHFPNPAAQAQRLEKVENDQHTPPSKEIVSARIREIVSEVLYANVGPIMTREGDEWTPDEAKENWRLNQVLTNPVAMTKVFRQANLFQHPVSIVVREGDVRVSKYEERE
jgi:hypothetical protein